MLWGNAAREKAALVSGSGRDNGHLVLQTVRPLLLSYSSLCFMYRVQYKAGLVFLLWGNAAREKAALVSGSGRDNGHLVLQTVRPPYARMRSPCPITL